VKNLTDKIYPGDTIARTFTFTDQDDAAIDPDTIVIEIVDSSGTVAETQSKGDLENTETGTYRLLYTLASDAAAGVWDIKVVAEYAADDLVNEEHFAFTVSEPPSAPYATLDEVKNILRITSSDGSQYDDELSGCLLSANGLTDSYLAKRGLTSASPTPQNIIDASNHYAAWLFRHRRDPAGADAFLKEAEKFLDAYCDSQTASLELPIVIAQDTGD
jgi:hypothetical protein